MAIKKGSLVTAIKEKLENSVEALANDTRWSSYIFETPGEVVDIRGDYIQVKFGQVPTPPIWFNKEQLQEWVKP
ncbi:MAG: NAD(P)H-quinone oxidoreductase subunit O [Pseudanabaenaceae cyanobacterium]